MSVVDALRSCPKGRLKYNRLSDLSNLKDAVSPPLSRFHEEKEASILNTSFGLDFSSASEQSFNKSALGNTSDISLPWESNSSPTRLTTSTSQVYKKHDKSVQRETRPDDGFESKFPEQQSPSQMLWSPQEHHFSSRYSNQTVDQVNKSGKSSPSPNQHSAKSPDLSNRLMSVVSPDHWHSLRAIMETQEHFNFQAKRKLHARSLQFAAHLEQVNAEIARLKQEAKLRAEHLEQMRNSSIEKTRLQKQAEGNKTLQSLKQNQEKHKEKMDSKQREIERKRLEIEKEENKRREEQALRLQQLHACQERVAQSWATFARVHDTFQHKQLFPEGVGKVRAVLAKVNESMPGKLQKVVDRGAITDQDISEFEDNAAKSEWTIQFLNKKMGEIEALLKAAEEKKKEEEAKQAEDQRKAENTKKLEAEAAQDFEVQALKYCLIEMKASEEYLSKVEESIKGFISNPQMKQYRFDIQRAVNTNINTISGVDARHLRDKLDRLLALLKGQEVEVSGRRVKADNTPESLLFCQNLIAKMLVRKGEEQIGSLHESAFPLAAVVLGLWSHFPVVGNLFLAHMRRISPYTLPYHHSKEEGQSSTDYHRSLGYKVDEDGKVEEQDKFLRRMSGLMHLYFALMVTTPPPPSPRSAPPPHPHGLEHAWGWLARAVNTPPLADISAECLTACLTVCGSELCRVYQKQGLKLIQALATKGLARLDQVSVTSASLARLRGLLQTAVGAGGRGFKPPQGALPEHFWRSF